VGELTRGLLGAMSRARLQVAAGILAAVVLAAGGAWGLVAHFSAPGRANGPARPGRGEEAIFQDDQELIQGTWQVVNTQAGGVNDANPPFFEKVRWRFQGDHVTWVMNDQGRELTQEFTFQLDPGRRPRAMDLTPFGEGQKGPTMPCVYELNGDTLQVCTADPNNMVRPQELASRKGSNTMLWVFKRQSLGQDQPR
jgi:uncharacterized protein (TIGR03067 family)